MFHVPEDRLPQQNLVAKRLSSGHVRRLGPDAQTLGDGLYVFNRSAEMISAK